MPHKYIFMVILPLLPSIFSHSDLILQLSTSQVVLIFRPVVLLLSFQFFYFVWLWLVIWWGFAVVCKNWQPEDNLHNLILQNTAWRGWSAIKQDNRISTRLDTENEFECWKLQDQCFDVFSLFLFSHFASALAAKGLLLQSLSRLSQRSAVFPWILC